jgi:lipoprotein-anchoring transpeptidase ErfK/SrfK
MRRGPRRAIATGLGGVLAVAVFAVLAVWLGAVGGERGSTSPTLPPGFTFPKPSATAARGPSSTTRPTVAPLAPNTVLVAQATVPTISVYDQPNAASPARALPNPWTVDPTRPASKVPQVFLVRTRQANGWIQVLLPVRPNGSTGWVRAADVDLSPVSYRVRVELGAHRITVLNGERTVYEGPIAVGAAATPTPTGRYYVRVLMKAPNPNTVYGPYAYGLSSHSDVLESFNGGDGEIGIHGNNDASVLGRNVTHGCIRMDNDEITELASLLPLGTPVDVAA